MTVFCVVDYEGRLHTVCSSRERAETFIREGSWNIENFFVEQWRVDKGRVSDQKSEAEGRAR